MCKSLSWRVCSDAEREVKLQFQQKLEQERAQWAQYRDGMEREMAELRRRLSEGQEEENLENEMKKVRFAFWFDYFLEFYFRELWKRYERAIFSESWLKASVLVLGVFSELGFVLI